MALRNKTKYTKNNPTLQSLNLSISNKINDQIEKSKINSNNYSDFDLNTPCQYFKSSFARSLTLETNDIKSLDFSVNFGLQNKSIISEEPQTLTDDQQNILSQNSIVTASNIISNDLTGSEILNKSSVTMSGTTKNNAWLISHKKEHQNSIEESRNLMNSACGGMDESQLDVSGSSSNIETIILQTQVDTLLWQLKQVEASRKMYRAVMEEVIRFLERCHRKLDSLESNTLPRSKSIHQVYQNQSEQIYSSTSTMSPRTFSSTNIDVHKDFNFSSKSNDLEKSLSSTLTYSQFRDLTWRRSPKRVVPLQLSSVDSEKLSKEAFRLLRTAQNLLKTQEPVLSQTQASTESPEYSFIQSQKKPIIPNSSYNSDVDSTYNTFSRKVNGRGSHISLRSSSIQSTSSSSKNETDEDNFSTPLINKKIIPISSTTTEDESGFSSINSFQEIGIPLQSTIICSSSNDNFSNNRSDLDLNNSILILDEFDNCADTNCLDSKNSTLKGSPTASSNTIGLPVTNHRRWSSAPIVQPRFSTISSKCTDASTVLWV